MSCAPNIRSLRFDENIVSLERKIHVAWLCKGCFKNGMFVHRVNTYEDHLKLDA